MKVLITGATSGIGEALVAHYLGLNAEVIACGRSQEKLTLLQLKHPSIDTYCFDLSDYESISQNLASLPAIELAILNAGDCEYIDDVLNFDAELFERVINVNLIAMGYLINAIIPKLIQSKVSTQARPQLALMSSSVTYLPFPKAQAYGASKAGVDYLANSLALELNECIDVSLIQPGFIKTPLTDKNTFEMPFIMSAEQAAVRIVNELTKRKPLIAFPKRLIYIMKLMSILPSKLWQRLNKSSIQLMSVDSNLQAEGKNK